MRQVPLEWCCSLPEAFRQYRTDERGSKRVFGPIPCAAMGLGDDGSFLAKKKKATCWEPDEMWDGGFLKLAKD